MEGTSQKLIVIDDDLKLNRLMTDYLGGMGFQVLTAIKPSEGLKFLEREKPDLVILDIMLPKNGRPGSMPDDPEGFEYPDHHAHRTR